MGVLSNLVLTFVYLLYEQASVQKLPKKEKMKANVFVKACLTGTSKKTGNLYDFIQAHYLAVPAVSSATPPS